MERDTMPRRPKYSVKARTLKIGGKYVEGLAVKRNKKGEWWINRTFNQLKIKRGSK